MGSDNKRISKRAPVVLRIKLRYTSVDSFVQKFATNLSPGGMFISSRAPKPIGTTVKFELRLADESAVINGSGVVRWTQEYDPEHPRRLFGMGIEFTQLSDESRAVIERIVEHKRALGLPDDDEIPMSHRREPQPQAEPESARTPSETEEAPPESGEGPRILSESKEAPTESKETESKEPAPERTRPRRQAVPIADLIARATALAPPHDGDEDDLLSEVDADLPNLPTALARARQLAGTADDDGELDALLKVSASPVARSVADASSALASMLGGTSVGTRRPRAPNGRAETALRPEPDDPDPEPDPAAAPEPEPTAAPEPVREPPRILSEALVHPEPAERAEGRTASNEPDRSADLEAAADALIAGFEDEPSEPHPIPSRRPELDPAPLPGMPPNPRTDEPPMLDASSISDTSSSGSIDLTDLADQLFSEGGADALSHDLDADALDAEALMASGVDRLITPRQRRKSAPVNLPEAPDLSSFADPPTMTGADPMPGAQPPPPPPSPAEASSLDDLDAALAALDLEPTAPPTRQPGAPPPLRPAASASDFDADAQPLLTRAEGPPLGMMPPPLPHLRAARSEPVDDEETDVGDFDVEIDIEADYDSFEAEPPQEVDPDEHVRRKAARAARARAVSEPLSPDELELDLDDEEAKKKGLFSRVFGRKK